MAQENRWAFYLAVMACVVAWGVVMLGAYTRLKDAGLGCPDWPGCYGQIVVPHNPVRILMAEERFPGHVIDVEKAWPEMIHRYAAGILGLLIFIAGFLTLRNSRLPQQPIVLSLALIVIVIFQALLGKWTVTMRLWPLVVVSHLLGGVTIFALLGLLAMQLKGVDPYRSGDERRAYNPWVGIAIAIVLIQILLGGWTSANYAALICPDFPFCHGTLWPPMDFYRAFHLWGNLGVNFQGGALDHMARVTIQMTHRFGGFIVFIYLSWLSAWVLLSCQTIILKRLALIVLVLLLVQISLGIINVVWWLPLVTAVLHNGVAALLLLSLVAFNYISQKLK